MASSGVALGFGAALAWGLVDAMIAVLTRRASPLSVVLAVHGSGIVILTSLAFAIGEAATISPAAWAAMLVLSPVGGMTYLVFYRALALGPIAVVSPIASANGVLVIGLAVVVLGDPLSWVQACGAALVLGCSAMAATQGGDAGRGSTGPGGPRLAVIASLSFGVYLFGLIVLVGELGWLLPILLTRAGGVLILIALGARRPDTTLLRGRTLALAASAGALEVLGYALFNRAAALGDAAAATAAAAAYPIVPTVYGLLAFGERLARHQVVGITGVMGGMALLGLG